VLTKLSYSLYCTKGDKEKALVLFVGDGQSAFIPEVRAVDISELVPVNTIREPNNQPILYEKDIL